MNLKIKPVKKLIAFVATMFIFCSTFAQPYYVDVQLSNVHIDNNHLVFTVKMRAGAGYLASGWQMGGSNIFFEAVQSNGTPAIEFVAAQSVPGILPTSGALHNSVFHNAATLGGVPGRIGLVFNRYVYNDPPGDIHNEFRVVGTFRVAIANIISTDAYLVMRSSSETLFRSEWHGFNHATQGITVGLTPGQLLNQPFNSIKSGFPVLSGCPPQALWTGAIDSDWFDADNWVNPVDQSPVIGVPCATTDVYIPGTTPRFPMLAGNNRTAANVRCKDITFFQGGQIGRIDLLTYERARTQLNMYSPFYQLGYNTGFNNAFWNYSHYYSTPPLANGQWHMLSMPLKGIVSGDLAYG